MAVQNARRAEQEVEAAERAKKDDLKALARARQALASIDTIIEDEAALLLSVQTDGSPGILEFTTFTDEAALLQN